MRSRLQTPPEEQVGNGSRQGAFLLWDTHCGECWCFTEQDWEPGEFLASENPGFTATCHLLLSGLVLW